MERSNSVLGRGWILAEIVTQWNYLAGIFDRTQTNKMENTVVVGTWSVKDLFGHITTWENETINNIQRFLDPQTGSLSFYPDAPSFNDSFVEARSRFELLKVAMDLEETHTRLIEFLMVLPVKAFQQEDISRRIRLDTYEHYKNHAETLSDWLNSAGA